MGEVGTSPTGGISAPERLNSEHDVSAFDCGISALDEWLRTRALRSDREGHARTFVACIGLRVAGYCCLSAGAVERGSAPSRLRRNAPDPVPVALIGRLAADRAFRGRGLGADLLQDALFRILAAAETIGIRAVLVHAIDERAAGFWRSFEFLPSPADPNTLFLPVEQIRSAL